tara:strand:- start:2244 stop:2477 length:234 start_codon:yes stop_codon:yes gene_type:complete
MTLDGIKERLAFARVATGLIVVTDASIIGVTFNSWGNPAREITIAWGATSAIVLTAMAVCAIIYATHLIRRMEEDHA